MRSNVTGQCCYDECRLNERHYAYCLSIDCLNAEYLYAEFHYSDCLFIEFRYADVILPIVVTLSVLY